MEITLKEEEAKEYLKLKEYLENSSLKKLDRLIKENEVKRDDLQREISSAMRYEKHLKEISNEVYNYCIFHLEGSQYKMEFNEDFNSFGLRNSYEYDFRNDIRVIEPKEFSSFLETIKETITSDKKTIEKLEKKLKEKSFFKRVFGL